VIRHSRYSSTVLSGTYHIATHRDVSTKERRAAELPVRVAVGCCEAHVSCCMVCHSATAALCTKHCAALHCAALHCTALHCTALHCTAWNTYIGGPASCLAAGASGHGCTTATPT
jgi:hypothetical protein